MRKFPFLVSAAALVIMVATGTEAAQKQSAPAAASSGKLTEYVRFPVRQVTGIAVTEDGRIFVNMPRWASDVDISVAELSAGKLKPYPNADWNAWRNAKELSPQDHFICVQSVVADKLGFLWVLDPAAPAMDKVVAGGPKLVKIDLSSNQVVKTISFDETVAPQGSYLNDIRFTPDGKFGFVTDSGAKGAIVVVDLQKGTARRVLDGHPSTQPEPDVVVHFNGKELRRTDGRALKVAADSLAISADGTTLYWQALTGQTLYRAPTNALEDAALSSTDLAAKVEKVGTTNVADGYLTVADGKLLITAPEENAVKVRDPDGALSVLVKDARLRWPDSMAQGKDGTIYLTTSHIPDMPWFTGNASKPTPSEIWKISQPKPAAPPTQATAAPAQAATQPASASAPAKDAGGDGQGGAAPDNAQPDAQSDAESPPAE